VAKENAEASELQFRLLVENAPEPIYIQIDAKFDYLNKAAINLYGADSDEKLLGTSIEERIHPDYIDLVKHSINQLNVDKNPVNNIQIKHLTLDNNPIEVEVSAVPIKFNNKDGALVFVKDITERKEYELKLQRSFDLLKNLTAQVPGVVYQYRLYPDGRSAFPYSSPGMYEIYEVTSEDVREDASAVFTRLHPDDLQFIVDTIMESARNQTIYHSEFRVILPKQGIRWRHCDAKPELLGDGSTLWHGIISDITERKQAEEKIKEQQLLFETMFNTITDGVIITNTERRILHANSGMQTTFGYLPGEIIGEPIEIIYADSDKYLKTGEDVYNESPLNSDNFYMTSYKDKFNNIFPGETFGAKLYDSNGEWIGNLGIIRNISERVKYIEELKIAREKAEVSDNLKTAFLHNISHEIRTPMNAIIGFSELLVLPKRNPEKNKLYADIIIQSANQLLSIIDDIINLATIEAGQVKLQKSKFELNATLKYIYQQFVLKARNQNIGFYFNTGLSDDFCLHTDKTKFTEILINLIGNAIKFTKRGEVSFGYQQKGNEVEFYVIDTGIGIPLEMHEEIFKRFRQVETAESRQFGGTGLGLSISKAYVELLSGKIWLKSEPGKGSSFFFTIPFEQVTMDNLIEASDDEDMELKFEQPKSILIAEDEDSNFTLLEELLSVANLKIFRATNGVEAIEIFKSNASIDLVLMDIKMPLKDGYEAIKEIKTINPDIPIIAQTAYSNEADMKKAISAGCIDTLAKPIDRNRLIAMLKKHLK
jgi:PAS domain S-box-containing protein